MARDFFAPLLISGLEDLDKKTVEIHVTSDLLEARDLTVLWKVTDLSGRPLSEGRQDITAPASANTRVTTLDLTKEVDEHGFRNLLIWLDLYTDQCDDPSRPISSNLVLMARPKHLELEPPGISATAEPSGKAFTVTLNCKSPALWTWLELEDTDATFSDNFVHLAPGRPVRIEVVPAETTNLADFQKQLKVRSLTDTY
jgi:beta-mannosidase